MKCCQCGLDVKNVFLGRPVPETRLVWLCAVCKRKELGRHFRFFRLLQLLGLYR